MSKTLDKGSDLHVEASRGPSTKAALIAYFYLEVRDGTSTKTGPTAVLSAALYKS
jgi:hypothetical protein